METKVATQRFRFGLFEFDAAHRELRREGAPVHLQPQSAQILARLVQQADRTVSREELRETLWGGETFVDFDRSLNFAVSQLRAALRDDAAQPTYIRTVPKLGYQFIAPVTRLAEEQPGPSAQTTRTMAASMPGWFWIAATATLLAAVSLLGAWLHRRYASTNAQPIVAVLRFDNETGDPALDTFSEALTDSVVQQLTDSGEGRDRIIGNALILRTSRHQRDLPAIASSLKAHFIILGQVQGSKTHLRVLAHLIRMPGQTHLWVVRKDTSLTDPLQLESDLAGQITAEFTPKIAAASD